MAERGQAAGIYEATQGPPPRRRESASARAAELAAIAAENGHEVTTASEMAPPDATLAFQAPGAAKVVTASVPEARRSARQGLTTAHALTCKCGICKPPKGNKR
jgi:hypothetical protein